METQNITLSVRKDVLRKVKLLAVRRNTSLSRLLTETLEELVAREDRYEAARRKHLAMLERGFELGTGGVATWRRDDLHER